MAFLDHYRREESTVPPGDYRVVITNVEDTVSKSSGRPMLRVTVRVNGTPINVSRCIVEGPYANRYVTQLKDSFAIDEDDNFLPGWIGAMGAAHIEEDENGFLTIKRFLHPSRQDPLPPWQGELPTRPLVTDLGMALDDDEEIPF